MDFGFDNFISYPKSPDVGFPSSFPEEDDLFPNGYLSTPDMNQWGSFPSESLQTNTNSPPTSDSYTTKLPFTIIRTKTNDDLKQVSGSTKVIKKKQKAKERAERKEKELNQLLTKASKKYIPPALYDPTLDPKTKRHLVQVVKNRMAAQQSRDKKRQEVEEFDEVKRRLEDENRRLLEQNSYLMDKLKQLEENQMRILAENQQLKLNQNQHREPIAIDTHNNSFMTQKSIPTEMGKQIVIDISDDEKANNELMCESPLGPVLSRGSKKRTPFGYLFSLTTILMVFQTLTMGPPIAHGPMRPKGPPMDGEGPPPYPPGPGFGPPPPPNGEFGPGPGPGSDTAPPDGTDPFGSHNGGGSHGGSHGHGSSPALEFPGGDGSEGNGKEGNTGHDDTVSTTDAAGSEGSTEGTEQPEGENEEAFGEDPTGADSTTFGPETTESEPGTDTDPNDVLKVLAYQPPHNQTTNGSDNTTTGDNSTIFDNSNTFDNSTGTRILVMVEENGEGVDEISQGIDDNEIKNEIEMDKRASSNTKRLLLDILTPQNSEVFLGKTSQQPKRLLESLYEAINIEPERRH